MALALFLLVSTHCFLYSSALKTNVPVDDFAGNHSMLVGRSQSAAGCWLPGLGVPGKDGVVPNEDLKRILKDGFKLFWGGQQACKDRNKNVTWCKAPRTDPLLGEHDQEWYAELVDYLKREFAQTDKSLPIVAAAYDRPILADAKSAQIMNLVCGFLRLNMSKRFVLFAGDQTAYDSYVRHFPNITVVFHPLMTKFAQAMAARTNVEYVNRVTKLAVAQMVLDAGRDVIITDTDIAWLRDSSEVLHASGLDFAAQPDCPAINSGFVYYRNVPKTRELLHMTLSTWRESWFCGDNDQYVLTCGWMRAAIKGLSYKVLPKNSWAIKCQGVNCACTDSPHVREDTERKTGWSFGQQMFGIGDGYPYIYHTYGMSGPYMNELDTLAALDMVDVDYQTGQCKMGPKMNAVDTFAKSCSTGEGGIIHATCDTHPGGPSCQREPVLASSIIADLEARSTLTTFVPP